MNNEEKLKLIEDCRTMPDNELFDLYLSACEKDRKSNEYKDIIYDVLLERGLII